MSKTTRDWERPGGDRQGTADHRHLRRRGEARLRFRTVPVAFGALVALLAIFFTLTGNIPGVFFLLPTALVLWFVFLRPLHRKR